MLCYLSSKLLMLTIILKPDAESQMLHISKFDCFGFAAGPKSMESWGGKGEGSVAASRHPSWDEEDDGGGGVWNSTGSQGSSSSFNSGGWGQSHGGKRGNIKVGKRRL